MDASTPSPAWASYLRWLFATVIALLAAVAAFNAFIDPQGIFGSPRVAGINASKPYLDHHRELARWQAARRLCADTAIFGNSRAEIGFDPEHPAFAAHGLSAFNHAIPGSTASLALQQLSWLQSAGCAPKMVIVGVEFLDFLSTGEPAPTLPAELPPAPTLPAELPPAPQTDARVMAETVFSIAGLRDAIKTLALQHSTYPAVLTERGFNPLLSYIPEVESNGHYVLFRQRADENRRLWNRKGRYLQPRDGGPSIDQQTVEAFVARATAGGARVNLVIYPYHAQMRMMQERMGLGGLVADWKKLVVAIAARHPGVQVWDFSAIAPETLEAIPAPGDRTSHLQYYWEAGHFKKALGDKAIARMLGEDNGFGIELRSDNLDAWIARDRSAVQALLTTPSALLDDVNEVLNGQ